MLWDQVSASQLTTHSDGMARPMLCINPENILVPFFPSFVNTAMWTQIGLGPQNRWSEVAKQLSPLSKARAVWIQRQLLFSLFFFFSEFTLKRTEIGYFKKRGLYVKSLLKGKSLACLQCTILYITTYLLADKCSWKRIDSYEYQTRCRMNQLR